MNGKAYLWENNHCMLPPTIAPTELYPWTVAEYRQMIAAGIIEEDARVELLQGQIMLTTPVGRFHAACVSYLNEWLTGLVNKRYIVRIQDPISLGDRSEPEPDLAIVQRRADYYAAALPGPEDLVLLIEVADTSLVRDKTLKAPLYASFAVEEYWLIDLNEQELYRYTSPDNGAYQSVKVFRLGDILIHPTLGEVSVSDLFPWL